MLYFCGVVVVLLGNVGSPITRKYMSKSKSSRLDFDYQIEKDRKENHKRSKAWRDMRKNKIRAKRVPDSMDLGEDAKAIAVGFDGVYDMNEVEGYGLG